MIENEGMVVELDRPRRIRLTIESVAAVEKERGVDFRTVCKPSADRSNEAWMADMLWAFGLADDPKLTPLEARQIIRKWITGVPRNLVSIGV